MVNKLHKLNNKLNLLFFTFLIKIKTSPLSVLAAQNLDQSTATKITSDGLFELDKIFRVGTIVLTILGFSFTSIALGINAYYQSKSIQEGNANRSQQEWKQMVKLLKNVALFTFFMGILSAFIVFFLRGVYNIF